MKQVCTELQGVIQSPWSGSRAPRPIKPTSLERRLHARRTLSAVTRPSRRKEWVAVTI